MTSVLDEIQTRFGWQEVPLRAVGVKVSEAGFPNLESLSVFLDSGVVPRSSREDNHNQLGESLDKYQRVLPNDLVFNKLRTWQGGFGISKYEGIVSPAYIIVRLNTEMIHPRFLGYLLKSNPYLAELTRLSKWMPPTQFDISWESLRDLQLRIPPIEVQRKIADYLDEQCHVLDRVHDQHEKVQTNVLELTKSEREKLIRGGAKGKKFVPGWLGEIDKDWLAIRLGRIASFKSGVGFPEEYQGKSYGDFPFMKVADLGSADSFGILKTADNYVDLFDAKLLGARVAPTGTIVFPKVGAALLNNRRAILGVPSIFDNNVMGLLFKDGNNRFWYHVLRSVDMGRIMNPGPVPSIGASQVSEIALPFPPLDEQSKIASRLDEIDQMESNLLSKNEAVKVKLAEYKKSLITTAVLGEIDVTSGKRVA